MVGCSPQFQFIQLPQTVLQIWSNLHHSTTKSLCCPVLKKYVSMSTTFIKCVPQLPFHLFYLFCHLCLCSPVWHAPLTESTRKGNKQSHCDPRPLVGHLLLFSRLFPVAKAFSLPLPSLVQRRRTTAWPQPWPCGSTSNICSNLIDTYWRNAYSPYSSVEMCRKNRYASFPCGMAYLSALQLLLCQLSQLFSLLP